LFENSTNNEGAKVENNSEERIRKLEDENANLNKRINTIVKELDEQNQKSEKYIKDGMWVMTSAVEAMSIIRYYDLRTDGITLSLLEGAFSCLKRIERIRQTTSYDKLREYVLEREQNITGALLELTKHKNILPNEVLDRLLKEYGTNVFREIVLLEDVISSFGTDEALRWKQLLT
jgi:hypothetical protein